MSQLIELLMIFSNFNDLFPLGLLLCAFQYLLPVPKVYSVYIYSYIIHS